MAFYPSTLSANSATRGIDTVLKYSPNAFGAYKLGSVSGGATVLPPIQGPYDALLGYGGTVFRSADPLTFGSAFLALRVGRRPVAVALQENRGT